MLTMTIDIADHLINGQIGQITFFLNLLVTEFQKYLLSLMTQMLLQKGKYQVP